MIAILLALVAVAPPSPSPERLPAHGRVTTPAGVRFQLPPGEEYATGTTEDGIRVYVSRPRDDSSFLSVQVVSADAESSSACDAAAGAEALRTASGLPGCLVSARSGDGDLAMAIAVVKGRGLLVFVLAAARSDAAARALATGAAASVDIGPATGARPPPAPRNDRRMVGCFERETRAPGGGPGYVRALWTRCFREDSTVSQRFVLAMSAGGAPDIRRQHRQGTWACTAGVLHLLWDNGDTERVDVAFGEENVVLGEELWDRTPADPDTRNEDDEDE